MFSIKFNNPEVKKDRIHYWESSEYKVTSTEDLRLKDTRSIEKDGKKWVRNFVDLSFWWNQTLSGGS